MKRLHKYNLFQKLSNCDLLKTEYVYLGLKIYPEGLHPLDEKIDAVKRAPVPHNVSELRSFLRLDYHKPLLAIFSPKSATPL